MKDGNMDHQQRAIFLAAVCGQTYDQYEHADGSFIVPAEYSLCHTIEAESVTGQWERFGFILESSREIIAAFRGTRSTTDWITDIMAAQKTFIYVQEDCLTHKGFTNMYASARDGILAALSKLPPAKPLYITGHSLGGALATLCAIDTAANSAFRSPIVYTYGSPRVGDPAFADTYASYIRSCYRYANLFDIVTYTPPTVLKLPNQDTKYDYRHVNTHTPLSFQNGSAGLNHIISSYFAALSKLDPAFAKELCAATPGFCP